MWKAAAYGEQVYEGRYRAGRMHGHGAYRWADGNRYEGELRNDKMHGRGLFTFSNGNRYEGEYRDGKPHGLGTYVFAGGDRYEGQWREGCFLGGQDIWANTTKDACGFE